MNNPNRVIETETTEGEDLIAGMIIQVLAQHYYTVTVPPADGVAGQAQLIPGISGSLQASMDLPCERSYTVVLNVDDVAALRQALNHPTTGITRGTVSSANAINKSQVALEAAAAAQKEEDRLAQLAADQKLLAALAADPEADPAHVADPLVPVNASTSALDNLLGN